LYLTPPASKGELPGREFRIPSGADTASSRVPKPGHVDSCVLRANNRVKLRRQDLRKPWFIVLVCVLGAASPQAKSQNVPSSSAPQTAVAEHDPEDAFLSTTGYTNAYFGFEFDFPPEARLKPVPMPATADRRTQLLQMLGPAPQHAGVLIFAYEYKGKNWTSSTRISSPASKSYTGWRKLRSTGASFISLRPAGVSSSTLSWPPRLMGMSCWRSFRPTIRRWSRR